MDRTLRNVNAVQFPLVSATAQNHTLSLLAAAPPEEEKTCAVLDSRRGIFQVSKDQRDENRKKQGLCEARTQPHAVAQVVGPAALRQHPELPPETWPRGDWHVFERHQPACILGIAER